MRFRQAITKDRPFDINDVQDHVLAVAAVHVDRVTLETFFTGVEDTADPAVRALLSRVRDLYALGVFKAHKGWFLEHGRLRRPARR
ncbi:acyl-CoA dehydrogenase [Micromonospora sp. DT43]|uniref:acyl-CoA dehydrogenase n=1 Tax=Micromonospora sp. DT43 TaxID=3393440 RepID=UPI003CE7BB51